MQPYFNAALLSISLAALYYALTISAIGIAAADGIFWWLTQSNPFTSQAQKFIGVGVAALPIAYLSHVYTNRSMWFTLVCVAIVTQVLMGNVHNAPWDPMGLVRSFESFMDSDLSGKLLLGYLILVPFAWGWLLQKSPIKRGSL